MTVRGRALIGLALGLVPAWRLLGVEELIHVSIGVGAMVGAALLWVQLGARKLEIRRELERPAIQRGEDVAVRVNVTNQALLPSLPVVVSEEGASFSVHVSIPSIGASSSEDITQSVTAPPRGRHRLYGIRVSTTDPLGIARRSYVLEQPDSLLVLPQIQPLYLPPRISAITSRSGSSVALPAQGDEFYGIRAYVRGDDPRKIHWRATARRDELMVRETEASSGERLTIVLDDRLAAYGGLDAFELALDAAASVASAYVTAGFSVRLVRPSSPPLPFGRGPGQLAKLLEALASATPASGSRPLRVHADPGARLVVVGRAMTAAESAKVLRAAAVAEDPAVIVVGDGHHARPFAGRRGLRLVLPAAGGLASAWARSLAGQIDGVNSWASDFQPAI